MVGITQLLCFCMKTLKNVVDSHSANCFKSNFLDLSFQHYVSSFRRFGEAAAAAPPFMDQQGLERGSTENLAALHSVAGLAGIGRCFPGALGNGAAANPGSKIIAFPERIHLDAEYRTSGERGGRNPLLRHSRSARHL